jgi:hypothetical protein
MSFEGNFGDRGSRGLCIYLRTSRGTKHFFLLSRLVEAGLEPSVKCDPALPVAISLTQETGISFCPWCGINLKVHYRRVLDRLFKMTEFRN